MKTLYQTQATAIGGRAGCAASADCRLRLDLSTPATLGGDDGPGTNPEQLFALGYAASFLSAIKRIAGRERIALSTDSNVTASIAIGPNDKGHGLALAIELDVDLPCLKQEDARRIATQAQTICPFCNAMRDNVEVRLLVA